MHIQHSILKTIVLEYIYTNNFMWKLITHATTRYFNLHTSTFTNLIIDTWKLHFKNNNSRTITNHAQGKYSTLQSIQSITIQFKQVITQQVQCITCMVGFPFHNVRLTYLELRAFLSPLRHERFPSSLDVCTRSQRFCGR